MLSFVRSSSTKMPCQDSRGILGVTLVVFGFLIIVDAAQGFPPPFSLAKGDTRNGCPVATPTSTTTTTTRRRGTGRNSIVLSIAGKAAAEQQQNKNNFEESLVELESEALYGLGCRQSDLSNFASKLENGALNLFPDYQRAFVWDPPKSSRLIATVLCNRFMPPLVLHEKSKGTLDVVDGKQRLTSLLGFYMNRKNANYPSDRSAREQMMKLLPSLATLSKLDESYRALNGLSFDDLTKDRQRAYECYSISYMVVPLNTPKADVFEVYEDINSGGENLTQQQVRRAVFHGPYMKMIDDSKNNLKDFHAIWAPKAFRTNTYKPCKKDSDGELILRAFAFRQNGERFKQPAKKFLNRELEGSDDFDTRSEGDKQRVREMVADRQKEFESVMRVARQVFGDKAFRKHRATISTTMWDAKYSAIAELLTVYKEVDFTRAKGKISEALRKSIATGFFSRDDEQTSAVKFVSRKDQLRKIMQDAIQTARGPRDTKRTFPSNMKWDLFDRQAGTCALCKQTIEEQRLEDNNYVHIDHIVPHSNGGPTDISNAQLTHRECNLQKGAGTF